MGNDQGAQVRKNLKENLLPQSIKRLESCKSRQTSHRVVTDEELATLWNLFDSLQSRSLDKFGLDKEIFFQFVNIAVRSLNRYSLAV